MVGHPRYRRPSVVIERHTTTPHSRPSERQSDLPRSPFLASTPAARFVRLGDPGADDCYRNGYGVYALVKKLLGAEKVVLTGACRIVPRFLSATDGTERRPCWLVRFPASVLGAHPFAAVLHCPSKPGVVVLVLLHVHVLLTRRGSADRLHDYRRRPATSVDCTASTELTKRGLCPSRTLRCEFSSHELLQLMLTLASPDRASDPSIGMCKSRKLSIIRAR